MATITISSTNSSRLSPTQTFELENKSSHARDISFSSYLNNGEEAFVKRLAESTRRLSANICSTRDHNDRLHLGNKNGGEEGEIGVFGAEKYFNGGMDSGGTPRIQDTGPKKYQLKIDDQSPVKTAKCRIQPGTPSTLRSESSWNSQSALLQSAMKNSWKKNRPQRKGILASLRSKCYCTDKDVVDISDQVGELSFKKTPNDAVTQDKAITRKLLATGVEPKNFVGEAQAKSRVRKDSRLQKSYSLDVGMNKVNYIGFPKVSSGKPKMEVKAQFPQALEQEEIPRKSLEVFGSPLEKRNRSFSFDKRAVMLPWDARPRMEEIEFCVNSGGIFNDSASDASSDLFEIDSLNSCTGNPFLTRQASSATSGCVTSTTCYAPSEASIEWSVVTASAAEFSVLSDCEDQRPPAALACPSQTPSTPSTGKSKATSREIQRRRAGILSDCRSHKAVKVAGDAYRTNVKPNKPDPQIRLKTDSSPRLSTMYQVDTKQGNANTMRHGQHVLAAQTLRHSQPQHNSHLLYIQ